MHVGVLIPIPVGQPKLVVTRQLLANLFEVKQVSPVPIKKMLGAVLAEREMAGDAMNGGLAVPASRVSGWQASGSHPFHQLHRLSIGLDVGVDLRRACAETASNGSVLDRIGQLFAAAH